jgi:hypothetical protein
MSDLAIFDEVEMLTIQADAFRIKAEAMVIKSDEHVTGATNLLGFIAQAKKQFEDRRTGIVKPLNDNVKRVNDAFKTITAPLDTANTTLKQKVLIYHREQERKRQEEIARIEAERKVAEEQRQKEIAERQKALDDLGITEGDLAPLPGSDADNIYFPPLEEIAPVVLPPVVPTMTKASLGSATVKKVWAFEITAPADVPREYLTVDEKKIREAVRAGVREIPGVRIYQDDQLAVSGR